MSTKSSTKRKTRQKPSPKTKTRLARARRRKKGVAAGPAKARRLRRERKALRPSTLTHAPVLDRVRGKASVRNAELGTLGSSKTCSRCSKSADTVVFWEYWLGGFWRKATRNLCSKHGRKLKARLDKAQPCAS